LSYQSEIVNKQFTGNVVIKTLGYYFTIRQPDSGLTVEPYFNGLVSSLVLNPTQIDIRKVSSTISSFSFRLLDKKNVISQLVQGNAANFANQSVEIWIGRSGVSMSFSAYLKLQTTKIKKVDYADGGYNFSTVEETDRLNSSIFQNKTRLNGDILAETTSFSCKDDISSFPASGYLKVENEIVSYSSYNSATKTFSGVVRGEYSTTPDNHSDDSEIYALDAVTDNPINIILKILVSKGGGGSYDVLNDGAAISQSLIDVSGIEALRDTLFSTVQFRLFLYQIDSALKFIEDNLLSPIGCRFVTSQSGKLTIKQADPAIIRDSGYLIDDDTIKANPKWTVDISKIVNKIEVKWDYSENIGKYLNVSTYSDEDSIASYGASKALTFSFKGVRTSLSGKTIIDDFGNKLLNRLSKPTPEITLNTQIDKSLYSVLDRILVNTSQIPAPDGSTNFDSELEIITRAINYQTGDVQFKLVYTSSSIDRLGFISPSDTILSNSSQKIVTLSAGRGDQYLVGWKMRLWDNTLNEYTSDAVNTITAISSDNITFENNFSTTIIPGRHRIKFADYDEVVSDQKRYAFIIKQNDQVFFDGKRRYIISI